MKIIGKSKNIAKVEDLIKKVAETNSSVLITGASGTGKELVAKNIHKLSTRNNGPFIPVNCGAIPNELLESELFGHEKGAFTGAIVSRKGRFELANNGTILLDEIGDMPLFMQVKILRVIQERAFEKVGGTKTIRSNVRIIAASNQNLEELVKENKFREDLFYRLNVFPIHIPLLKERKEDIPLLIEHFLKIFSSELNTTCELSDSAIERFMEYDWPGNIRELSNVVERICILNRDQKVDVSQLPEKILINNSADKKFDKFKNMTEINLINSTNLHKENFNLKDLLQEIETHYISQAITNNKGVISKAAKSLGVRRTTLVEKMKKYNIQK